jgi:hypothetical protein
MSHLFKKNKNLLISIKIFLFILFLSIFLKTIFIYSGNKITYLLFSIISFYLLIFSFRKNSFFYENFFGVFILLGFWIKFSIILGILKTGFTEGVHGPSLISPKNFDDALVASSVGILGFMSFGYIRQIFLNYPLKLNIKINTKLYSSYRPFILTSFFLVILIICLTNYYFQIYQRGFVGQNYHFIINGFIKTSLLYFLTLCSAIILYFDALNYKKIFLTIILLILFETTLSSVSMLSRGMIFNSLAIIYGLYKFTNKIDVKVNYIFFLKILTIIVLFFTLSVFFINQLRINIHNNLLLDVKVLQSQSNNIPDKLSFNNFNIIDDTIVFVNKSWYRFKHLAIHRWVGIDSMILITQNKELLSFNLFKEALKEKFDSKSISFYEDRFMIYSSDHYSSSSRKKGNTLPGLIAFLFFSGSYFFLFFAMMFFCLIASILEFLIFKSLSGNLIASSLIGMVISYRFVHFGYLPAQSYLLFGSIIGVIIIFFVINFVYRIYRD